jgi:predicted kinase
VGGSPGTGKTTVAGEIGAQLPVVVLRSDELRPGSSTAHEAGFGVGRYTAEAIERNYRDLVAKARQLLALGESVVLDASWSSERMRSLAREAATATASDLIELRCVTPAEVAGERIRARRAAGADLSDATPEIAAALTKGFDPWIEASTIDTTAPVAQSVDRAVTLMKEVDP